MFPFAKLTHIPFHPELTKGDIRIYILSHLQFSVSAQATLLGISPSSVTKARQRLKAKL